MLDERIDAVLGLLNERYEKYANTTVTSGRINKLFGTSGSGRRRMSKKLFGRLYEMGILTPFYDESPEDAKVWNVNIAKLKEIINERQKAGNPIPIPVLGKHSKDEEDED
ncbi:MAG: hypothetical protein QW728_07665 [Thermoplasmata archaeon]